MPALYSCYDAATTEIYTLSLHDALPICAGGDGARVRPCSRPGDRGGEHQRPYRVRGVGRARGGGASGEGGDRKSTRLNSSHVKISYAVFCLKKKKKGHRNKGKRTDLRQT